MTKRNYFSAFILLTSLFFMWGLITVLVDSLIPRLREIFEISYFQSGLVQFAFFIAYGLVSIPAGFLLQKIGYKRGLVLGLAVMGIGCLLFYPAASSRIFWVFLMAYFTLASGMTVVQVAANPYVTVLGKPEGASSRLNLAQALNSLGTAIAPAIGAVFILSDTIKSSVELKNLPEKLKEVYFLVEAEAVQRPFLVLAISLFVLAIIVLISNLPKILSENQKSGFISVLKHKKLTFGAIGVFLYVGAEVAIGSYLVNYFLDMNLAEIVRNTSWLSNFSESILNNDLSKVDSKGVVGAFVVLYWSGAMVGRFIGAYLTKKYNPKHILSYFAVGAIVMVILSMTTAGVFSMFAILAVGLFNSIMFPTIFSIAIEDLGHLKPEGSGILCTAIAGGAFIPPLYGFFIDLAGFKFAFLLIIICYGYIYFYGRKASSL